MPELSRAQGLRSFLSSDSSLLVFQATRGAAAELRKRLEERKASRALHSSGVPSLRVDLGPSSVAGAVLRVELLLAGALAALRRMVVVRITRDGEDPRAEPGGASRAAFAPGELRAAVASCLDWDLLEPASDEAVGRARVSYALMQASPALAGRAWLDGEAFPFSSEEISRLESLGILATPSESIGDALLGYLPMSLERPPVVAMVAARRSARGVADVLRRGLVARRLRLLLEDPSFAGTSAAEDLAGGGAAFVFARYDLGARSCFDPDFDYAILLDPEAARRVDRLVHDRDRYGSFSALPEALPSAELSRRLLSASLHPTHEVVFFDGVPVRQIRKVMARNVEARDALLRELPDGCATPIDVA
ncbi:MAG: hypothetical protein HYV07_25270 [Deltaproteobacteria bacterium]|nr:hypothetical protein [Deltaproteobacteria bacterium]